MNQYCTLHVFFYIVLSVGFGHGEGICDSNDILYREMGCKAVNGKLENNCARYYNCDQFFARDRNFCYSEGKKYEISESLTSLYYEKRNPCLADCYCTTYGFRSEEPKFVCALVECEYDPPDGCYLKYNTTSCCADIYCPKETNTVYSACRYKDRVIPYGERFYEESMSCVCNEDFNGSLSSKACRPIVCNYEIQNSNNLLKGCLPIYFGKLNGCAVYWRCYDEFVDSDDGIVQPGSRVIIDGKTVHSTVKKSLSSNPSHKCKFGNMTFNINDKLLTNYNDSSQLCVECVCNIPPLLTCFRNTVCESTLPTDIRVHAGVIWLLSSTSYPVTRCVNTLLYLAIIHCLYIVYNAYFKL